MPPTAQTPHPSRRQRRQGTATDHHVPEVSPQYGVPLPPDVRVRHPEAPRQRPRPPHPTSPGHHYPGDRRLWMPLLQPTQITTRTAQGNPIRVYNPTATARLPVPSDSDIIYFTDAPGTKQHTPTVGCASVRITQRADGLHVEYHTGATIFGTSSHGELRTLADAVNATPPPTTIRPRNIWVVVDATVDIHLTRRLADLPPHRALESGLTTQALRLWMAFRDMHPQDALHIVKQESQRYTYGNGRADRHAKQESTNHAPGFKHVRLDTPHHSHPQHLPPIPSATQPPQLDTTGHAARGSRQAVPLLHTHPAASHHAGPPSDHRTPTMPRRLRPYPPLLLCPTPG